MKNKYISGYVDIDQHTVDLDALITSIQDLKWNYFERYHREPKYIKIPMWLFEFLERYYKYTIAYSVNDNYSTYMGFIVCPTYSIDEINQIEVF